EAVDDRLAILEPALREQIGEARDRFAIPVLPVEHDHALHAQAIDEDRSHARVAVRLRGVVVGDEPADDHASVPVHEAQHGVEHGAARVLEVDVDATGTRRGEIVVQLSRAVVDARVEAELAHDVVAFGPAARDADRAAAHALRELSYHAADRAGCRRDDDRLAGLGLADLAQAEPRRDAGHAEDAEVV